MEPTGKCQWEGDKSRRHTGELKDLVINWIYWGGGGRGGVERQGREEHSCHSSNMTSVALDR